MSQRVPKVGVVGCGYWGKNLVRNFHDLSALGAVCDVDEPRLGEMRSKFGAHAVKEVRELLSLEDLDAVAIAAPAAQHHELAKAALLAGKDVFVEKPLALRVEEGEELVQLAVKQARILMVGHLLQYHPAVVELGRLVRAGELGRVQYIYSSRLNLGKLRTEENILWSFAPHDISAILSLLNEEPVSVAAHGGSYLNQNISDVTLTTCDFSSGVKAHIFVSWLHPYKEQKLVVVADRKMAVFDDTKKTDKLVLYPHQINWLDRVPVAQKADGQAVPIRDDEPLRLECEHFLECVRDRKKPRTDGESGLQVLRILRACEQSLREHGRPVAREAGAAKHYVHPTAIVDEPCEIGEGTRVWHFSHVMSGSKIGKNCILGQNSHIASRVRIGNNVKIQNNVSIYEGVELEDDVFCGPSMVFTNVITPRSHVSRKHEYQRTLVKRGATMGANSTILCGTTIGEYAFVAAGAVVTRNVPSYALMMGIPARQVGWMCQCGVRLGDSGNLAACRSCGRAYALKEGRLAEMVQQTSAARN